MRRRACQSATGVQGVSCRLCFLAARCAQSAVSGAFAAGAVSVTGRTPHVQQGLCEGAPTSSLIVSHLPCSPLIPFFFHSLYMFLSRTRSIFWFCMTIARGSCVPQLCLWSLKPV
ncbi:unnamed protein product [Prorocentrum cordatum]|uniref:Secreted protein n=1 Tax=Prorocentrum cordatum TaxID=2364126 RepID=A0ABN9THB2_9DINO|nr:unnamed protein product [Polarella glacialis]